MWRDKFNLGPEREHQREESQEDAASPGEDSPSADGHEEQQTSYFDGLYDELFEVNLFMALHLQSGEQMPIRVRLTVPDFNLGPLCETLHFNGIGYHCELMSREEEKDD